MLNSKPKYSNSDQANSNNNGNSITPLMNEINAESIDSTNTRESSKSPLNQNSNINRNMSNNSNTSQQKYPNNLNGNNLNNGQLAAGNNSNTSSAIVGGSRSGCVTLPTLAQLPKNMKR